MTFKPAGTCEGLMSNQPLDIYIVSVLSMCLGTLNNTDLGPNLSRLVSRGCRSFGTLNKCLAEPLFILGGAGESSRSERSACVQPVPGELGEGKTVLHPSQQLDPGVVTFHPRSYAKKQY